MRLFAIADIHGEADKLANLLVLLKTYHALDLNQDKIVFTGDYVDRGPDSYRVLELLYTLQNEYPNNVVCLAGNHEWMMIDYHVYKNDGGLWHCNGGKATERSFYKSLGTKKCPVHLLNWLKDLPLYHEEAGFFFSHAPVFKDEFRLETGNFTKEELTWMFHPDYLSMSRVFSDGKVGVCGHIHDLFNNNPHPRMLENYIFADAGCGCSKDAPLCAINVKTREVVYSL